MSEIVLDASVLIAILKQERFNPQALDAIDGGVISAVNFAEVLSKVVDFRMSGSPSITKLFALLDRIEPFTETQAQLAGEMRNRTRPAGLSLGDRACLALALELGAEVYTADRQWLSIDVGCPIHLIR